MELAQVVLLDVNNTAGESFQEVLRKEYGSEKTFFFKCDVQSEEQIKGNGHIAAVRIPRAWSTKIDKFQYYCEFFCQLNPSNWTSGVS